MPTFFDTLSELMAADVPLVSVTVVDTSGSAPQDRGAKMIVTHAGRHFGTVGGGKVETRAIAEAQRMLQGDIAGRTHFVQWNLAKDVGMTCGGIVRLYFESQNTATWNIVVFGAGHVANALASMLIHFDCRVAVYDPRPEWIARLPLSPKLRASVVADLPAMVAAIPEGSFLVLMTMGHSTDKPVLMEILRTRQFPYVGVIGSTAKANILKRDVLEAGLPEAMTEAFHCPIGLKIGSRHPYEIAVSVIAQLIETRDALQEEAASFSTDA